jgi:nicotinate phosphoribosyltransferase
MQHPMHSLNGLFTDAYEFTMAKALYAEGKQNEITDFDLFFRKVPHEGGYGLSCGVEQALDYLENLKFDEKQLAYLKKTFDLGDEQIDDLRKMDLKIDVKGVKEGTPVFPNEPIITVSGPAWQCMLAEVALLNSINYQTMVATRASRITQSAGDKAVLEFGARRAHSGEAALFGSRAAYIGGCKAVSLVEAGYRFDIPIMGTMAHSFMQDYGNDYDAFSSYVKTHPNNPTLLVDTYDVLHSGVPNAIKVFQENGITNGAIRLDSGDLAYLSKEARKMFDEAGLKGIRITASNGLDEHIIKDLIEIQKAPIDAFGVGEKLITNAPEPVFGCVYKLEAVDGQPRIKVAEDAIKTTIPGQKDLYRLYGEDGIAIADVMTMPGEKIPDPFVLFDMNDPGKQKVVTGFKAVPLHEQMFEGGKRVYESPSVEEIRNFAKEQMSTLHETVKRLKKPHSYYVDITAKLCSLREDMIEKARLIQRATTVQIDEKQLSDLTALRMRKNKYNFTSGGADGKIALKK